MRILQTDLLIAGLMVFKCRTDARVQTEAGDTVYCGENTYI